MKEATVNDSQFSERTTVYVENGHVTHFVFFAIASHQKEGSNRMNVKLTSLIVALLLLGLLPATGLARGPKPNIVVVMADDIGLGDIGFYHRQRTGEEPVVPTPDLDQLIKQGIRFSDAHSPASLCAPTRFSMLTGNWSYRNYKPFGVWGYNEKTGIEPEFTTSARIAKAGGYDTAFFGKWGLGGSWNKKDGRKSTGWQDPDIDLTKMNIGALYFGFDYSCELPQGIQGEPFAFYENQQWMPLKQNSTIKDIGPEQNGYATVHKDNTLRGRGDSNWDPSEVGSILASKAVSYIEKHATDQPDDPFFIYYCAQAVHLPHTPPKDLDGVPIAGSTPGVHGDMIRELDVQVGMLVDALKKSDVYDNTLFIFTSDNGGLPSVEDMRTAGHSSNNGWRGNKGSIHEGGHRVPFFAVWPGKIQPETESHEPIVGHDVVATIAALADQPISREVVMDSVNLLPLLTGNGASDRHQYLVHQSQAGPYYALREGDWKLIIKGEKSKELKNLVPLELYNLEKTPNEDEAQNLIGNAEYAERVQTMFARYQQLRTGGAPTISE